MKITLKNIHKHKDYKKLFKFMGYINIKLELGLSKERLNIQIHNHLQTEKNKKKYKNNKKDICYYKDNIFATGIYYFKSEPKC